MTTEEFSNEFDVLYNNIASNAAPGITEYEKSVFLTKAQSEIIKAYFENTLNKSGAGFDGSIKRQYDFSILLRTAKLFNINTVKERITTDEKVDRRSQVFIFPEDYFLSVNEVISDGNQFYSVLPIEYSEYQRMMTKPYPYPPKRVAWRIISDKKNCNTINHKFNEEGNINLKFLSTWADQKRTLQLVLQYTKDTSVPNAEICESKYIQFLYNGDEHTAPVGVTINGSWSNDNSEYICAFSIKSGIDSEDMDFELFFDIIKKAFDLYKSSYLSEHPGYKINTVMQRTDAFLNYEAPSKVVVNTTIAPITLKSEITFLPIAEVIGSFRGDINYQMRYIKKPRPIILEPLYDSGVSIDGEQSKSECELAPELHPEILQRAVELAKAAYIGDFNSTVGIGNVSSTNIGVVPQRTNR